MFRADFCFIVLVLALFDVVHFLLPAGAIGAHAFGWPGLSEALASSTFRRAPFGYRNTGQYLTKSMGK